jgi:predicted amidohydrolase YtcJ
MPILKGTVITVTGPRAEAVAFKDGKIVAVGPLKEVQEQAPGEQVIDYTGKTIMPGFVEAHSHPLLSGLITCAPVQYLFEKQGYASVLESFHKTAAENPLPKPLIFSGFDKLLHAHDAPTMTELDGLFGTERIVIVLDNSGHGVYFSSAAAKNAGFDPADTNIENPVGGEWLRNKDGTLNGQGFELPCVLAIADPILKSEIRDPLASAKQYYKLLSTVGVTTASELTFANRYKAGYMALAMTPHNPLRIRLYHMSTEPDCADEVPLPLDEAILSKQGIKLWADGSPWVGNIAISFPYLDTPATRTAGIAPDHLNPGLDGLNYSLDRMKEILDDVLTKSKPGRWQMAFHANGDLAIATSLDAYEYALKKYNLVGTDHRWRLEHLGGANAALLERAAQMGVTVSMSPFQFYYWGDLLDGQMFDTKYGAEWQPFKAAFSTSKPLYTSFHNDGGASPPSPLINIQTAVSRTTQSGKVHGINQAISLDEAILAETMHPARQLFMEHLVGSIEVGKLADFVILSKDPYTVQDPAKLNAEVKVVETWLGGVKTDLDAYLKASPVIPGQPAAKSEEHDHLVSAGNVQCCTSSLSRTLGRRNK